MGKHPDPVDLRRAGAATVRALRRDTGLSQEWLALEAGIGRAYLSALERGLHGVTIGMIYRLLPPLRLSFPQFAEEFDRQFKRTPSGRKQDDQRSGSNLVAAINPLLPGRQEG